MTEDGHAASGAEPAWVGRALEGVVEPMVELRRDIHAHPELAWQEVRTSALVADVLERAGLAPSILTAGTGVVCDVVGKPGGPQVALRADMDALPIDDEKSVPYRSTAPGVAHACGHDVHTAVVLGAGLGLARLAAAGELPGRVRLVFQPAEEVLPEEPCRYWSPVPSRACRGSSPSTAIPGSTPVQLPSGPARSPGRPIR